MRRSDGDPFASLGDDDGADCVDDARAEMPEASDEPAGPVPADVADIRALLADLSRLRLSVSADLSAAAGALEDGRGDVAGSMVDSARREVGELRTSALARGGIAAPPAPPPRPARRTPTTRRRARTLAGAVALALAVVLVPRLVADPQTSGPGAGIVDAQGSPVINAKLVSDEFEQLRQVVQQPDPNPADVIEAGRRWQRSLTAGLMAAATEPEQARRIVLLLRQERALLASVPQLRTPVMLDAVNTLRGNADNMLSQLRSIADTKVLAELPESITPAPVPSDSGGVVLADGGTQPVTTAPQPAPAPTGGTTGGSGTITTAPVPSSSGTVEPTSPPAPSVQPTSPPASGPTDVPTPAPTPSGPTPDPTPSPTTPPTVLPSIDPSNPLSGLFPLPSLPPVDPRTDTGANNGVGNAYGSINGDGGSTGSGDGGTADGGTAEAPAATPSPAP